MPELARPDEMKGLTLQSLEAILNIPPASAELAERRRKALSEIHRRGYAVIGGKRTPYRITRVIGGA